MFFPAPPPSSSSYSLSTRSVCLPGYLLSPKPCWSGLPPVVSTSTALFASASNLTTYLPPCLIHLFPHLPPTSNTCTRHPAFVMTGTGFLLEMQEKRDRRYNGHCVSKENITRKKTQERSKKEAFTWDLLDCKTPRFDGPIGSLLAHELGLLSEISGNRPRLLPRYQI